MNGHMRINYTGEEKHQYWSLFVVIAYIEQ